MGVGLGGWGTEVQRREDGERGRGGMEGVKEGRPGMMEGWTGMGESRGRGGGSTHVLHRRTRKTIAEIFGALKGVKDRVQKGK